MFRVTDVARDVVGVAVAVFANITIILSDFINNHTDTICNVLIELVDGFTPVVRRIDSS